LLWDLTRQELANKPSSFDEDQPYFECAGDRYHLEWRKAEERQCHFYHPGHPVAEALIRSAKSRKLSAAKLELNYNRYGARSSDVEALLGESGWLHVRKLIVNALDDSVERLLLAGSRSDGRPLNAEQCRKLLGLPARVLGPVHGADVPVTIWHELDDQQARELADIERRNLKFFDEEVGKLDRWAEDVKESLERELKDLNTRIADAKRLSKAAPTLNEKLAYQKQVKELESERNSKRKRLFESQDEVDGKRDGIISQIEERLHQKIQFDPLLSIQWTLPAGRA
jgi:adenine-specific DNA-methyltransferase